MFKVFLRAGINCVGGISVNFGMAIIIPFQLLFQRISSAGLALQTRI
jgi:hypothetical protein